MTSQPWRDLAAARRLDVRIGQMPKQAWPRATVGARGDGRAAASIVGFEGRRR
jgi:hypothetical protein